MISNFKFVFLIFVSINFLSWSNEFVDWKRVFHAKFAFNEYLPIAVQKNDLDTVENILYFKDYLNISNEELLKKLWEMYALATDPQIIDVIYVSILEVLSKSKSQEFGRRHRLLRHQLVFDAIQELNKIIDKDDKDAEGITFCLSSIIDYYHKNIIDSPRIKQMAKEVLYKAENWWPEKFKLILKQE